MLSINPIHHTEIIKKEETAKKKENHFIERPAQVRANGSYGRVLVKKKIYGTYSLNDTLPFENKTIEKFSDLTQDNVILTHLTNFLPESGVEKTQFAVNGFPRNTTHFALNHAVVNPLGAGGKKGWTDKEYAVFVPLKNAINENKPIGGKYNDFMFEGSFKIPEGSYIYRQNPSIEDGKIKFSKAKDLIGKDGITLIEGQMSPYEATDILCEKLGYTNLKDLHAKQFGLNMDIVNTGNDIEKMVDLANKLENGEITEEECFAMFGYDENWEPNEDSEEIEKKWEEDWDNFAKKYDYLNVMHGNTPYSGIEGVVCLLDLLDIRKSNWQENGIDFKENILKKIDKILNFKDLKITFVDVNALKNIITESSSPHEAVLRMQEELAISNIFSDNKIDEESLNTMIDKYLESDIDDDLSDWNW